MTSFQSRMLRQLGRLEFLRYFGASAVALSGDLTVYGLALMLKVPYPAAAALGFLTGLALVYFISVHWAFRNRRMSNVPLEFALFAGIGLVGLALTEMLLWIFIEKARLSPMVSKALAAGLVFCCNYALRKAFLFTSTSEAGALNTVLPVEGATQ